MDLPEDFHAIVRAAALKHKDDTQDATRQVFDEIKQRDDYEELAEELVFRAVASIVSDFRHALTTANKRAAGLYGGPAKVGNATGIANMVAGLCILDRHFIGTKSLGSLTGAELPLVRDNELRKADGHKLNAAICEAFMPYVAAEKTIRQCVTAKKAEAIFNSVKIPSPAISLLAPNGPVPATPNKRKRTPKDEPAIAGH